MGARRSHGEAKAVGDAGDGFAKGGDIIVGLINIGTDIGSHFHYGLVHFRFHFVTYHFLSFVHDLLLMAFQFERARVQNHVFFLHAKRKRLVVEGHTALLLTYSPQVRLFSFSRFDLAFSMA